MLSVHFLYILYVLNNINKIIMDGLTRREIEYSPECITRPFKVASAEDSKATVRSYVVGGRDVLQTWAKHPVAIVCLPDEYGWRHKSIRVFADELAFNNQAVVMVCGYVYLRRERESYKVDVYSKR